ncbi:MAG TPA: GDP-mannose 4,6-dehydratase, partial [Flavisolibacter sp.]
SIDPAYFRPTEVELLIGDATKARTKLGWIHKYDLPTLVKEMMKKDVEKCLLEGDAYVSATLEMV